jgi:hypothetical protein
VSLRASDTGVRTARPFNLKHRHFGALELAVRYGELRLDPSACKSRRVLICVRSVEQQTLSRFTQLQGERRRDPRSSPGTSCASLGGVCVRRRVFNSAV